MARDHVSILFKTVMQIKHNLVSYSNLRNVPYFCLMIQFGDGLAQKMHRIKVILISIRKMKIYLKNFPPTSLSVVEIEKIYYEQHDSTAYLEM